MPTPNRATAELVDPPIPFPAIWLASIIGTPVTGLVLYFVWRNRRPRAATHAGRATWIGFVLWLLVLQSFGILHGCAGTESKPAAPPPDIRSTPKQVTFTQIALFYRGEGSVAKVTRTKETALVLARELIARIRGGGSMESLVAEFTDDRGDDGKPFNSGSYTIARNTPTVATLKNAAFGLAVGELAPEPIDSGSAIHVIRRDD